VNNKEPKGTLYIKKVVYWRHEVWVHLQIDRNPLFSQWNKSYNPEPVRSFQYNLGHLYVTLVPFLKKEILVHDAWQYKQRIVWVGYAMFYWKKTAKMGWVKMILKKELSMLIANRTHTYILKL